MGKLAVVEMKSTTVSGPFRSAADGRPNVNVTCNYVLKGAAEAPDPNEAGATMGPAVLIS